MSDIDLTEHFETASVCIGGKGENKVFASKRCCKYCSKQFAPKTNTTNLRSHLVKDHKNVVKMLAQSTLPASMMLKTTAAHFTSEEFYKRLAKHTAILNVADSACESVSLIFIFRCSTFCFDSILLMLCACVFFLTHLTVGGVCSVDENHPFIKC